ncbi:uncharacterized protein EV420DRAFT_1637467 [Desarmillaria tabescens]|uniref:Secreted protein n=1 Tax=Armillaria tabescens TaxID=1929756 RepID=A0AA39NGQ2_ARMTA|nr:uncharacterized protein EV420DRAFT_1637467 [Desarmillaria tabescens]KAK0465324.1 hypothetical protein EV420DRAFT_1637467 [Desarmillaria tabescens]
MFYSFIALFFFVVSGSFAAVIPRVDTVSSAANSYSGNAGTADGGNVQNNGTAPLIEILSDNAGNGGTSETGPSSAQSGGTSAFKEEDKTVPLLAALEIVPQAEQDC